VPHVTLKLRHNPKTGKRDLVVEYESEDDALAHEHERDHRRFVEQLIGRSIDDLGPIGEIQLKRESPAGKGEESPQTPEAQRGTKPEPQGSGSG
jgi:hypothetical protein